MFSALFDNSFVFQFVFSFVCFSKLTMVSSSHFGSFSHPSDHHPPYKSGDSKAVLLGDVGKSEKFWIPFLYLMHPFNDFSATRHYVIDPWGDNCNSLYIPEQSCDPRTLESYKIRFSTPHTKWPLKRDNH